MTRRDALMGTAIVLWTAFEIWLAVGMAGSTISQILWGHL